MGSVVVSFTMQWHWSLPRARRRVGAVVQLEVLEKGADRACGLRLERVGPLQAAALLHTVPWRVAAGLVNLKAPVELIAALGGKVFALARPHFAELVR